MLYFCEELTKILIYLEGLMTHMGGPESPSVSEINNNNNNNTNIFMQDSCFSFKKKKKAINAGPVKN